MCQADGAPPRIALVGETLADARAVMVEGVSGLLAVHPPHARPLYEPSKRQVTWPSGAVAQLFSVEDPQSLAGRNSRRPGATRFANGRALMRAGRCCNSACGSGRARVRW